MLLLHCGFIHLGRILTVIVLELIDIEFRTRTGLIRIFLYRLLPSIKTGNNILYCAADIVSYEIILCCFLPVNIPKLRLRILEMWCSLDDSY